MTRLVHLDLCCGASGDMLLGALLDAGVAKAAIDAAIATLGLPITVTARPVVKRGIAATHVVVDTPQEHVHRRLPDIEAIIAKSTLHDRIKARARAVFRVLAEAEAHVHRIDIDAVHFHEVGALDAIADVVGVVAGFAALSPTAVHCRAVPVSHGTVRCAHGLLPVPAPAVLRLIEGLPSEPLDIEGETVTPTAAALLRVLVDAWSPPPPMRITAHGYGAGTKDFPRANVLRLIVGETATIANETAERLTVLECNLDDMNPEWLPPLLERLLAAGARDAWLTPITMKKGRPAFTLSVLCDAAEAAALRATVYAHSTTLGIRQSVVERTSLERRVERVQTAWGEVAVKVAGLPDGSERGVPEFADCERASATHGVALAEVYAAAQRAWQEQRSG